MYEQLLIAKLNLIASEIKHEDDLIGQRTTWLVISQSFLFGTFVAVLALKREGGMAAAFAKLLVVVIPLVGVLLPIVVLLALSAAASAIRQWRAEQDRLCGTREGGSWTGRGSGTEAWWCSWGSYCPSRWRSGSA